MPTATDNSEIPPEVKSNFNYPPQRMVEGIHVIIYTATDMSGNKEFCSITIKVKGKRISEIYEKMQHDHSVKYYAVTEEFPF